MRLLRFVLAVLLAVPAVALTAGVAQAATFSFTGTGSYSHTFFSSPNQVEVRVGGFSASADLPVGGEKQVWLGLVETYAGTHPGGSCCIDENSAYDATDSFQLDVTVAGTTLDFVYGVRVRWVGNGQGQMELQVPAGQTVDVGNGQLLEVTPQDASSTRYNQFASGAQGGGSLLAFDVSLRDADQPEPDLVDPTVACGTPTPTFLLNQPGATVSATVTDTGSGPASPTVTAPADTSTVGLGTVAVTGADVAGRTTTVLCPYTVAYGWQGFLAPVDTGLNSAKAGQTIPLKWLVTDYHGAPVTTLGAVRVTAAGLACAAGATGDQVEEYAAGASGLQNLGGGYYQFNWKTPKTYAGSCKTARLDLGDGIQHPADFAFTR